VRGSVVVVFYPGSRTRLDLFIIDGRERKRRGGKIRDTDYYLYYFLSAHNHAQHDDVSDEGIV